MKVSIDNTVEVSDEQRIQLANVLDEKLSKRQATRAELKEFIWSEGENWDNALADKWYVLYGEDPSEPAPVEDDADEDILGDDILGGDSTDEDDIL